jgi:hypothetical protein
MEGPSNIPPERNINPRQLIAEWKREAKVLLDANCRKRVVVRHLVELGCPASAAKRIVNEVGNSVALQHRILGLYLAGGGALLALVSLWLVTADMLFTFPLVEVGLAGTAVLGVLMVPFGIWKLLSGSAVDMETTLHGSADSELDEGR